MNQTEIFNANRHLHPRRLQETRHLDGLQATKDFASTILVLCELNLSLLEASKPHIMPLGPHVQVSLVPVLKPGEKVTIDMAPEDL